MKETLKKNSIKLNADHRVDSERLQHVVLQCAPELDGFRSSWQVRCRIALAVDDGILGPLAVCTEDALKSAPGMVGNLIDSVVLLTLLLPWFLLLLLELLA